MVIAAQKIVLMTALLGLATASSSAFALQSCNSAPIIARSTNVGTATFYAEDCAKDWKTQSIQMDFKYTHDIPGWAFRRAANYVLNKNVTDGATQKQLAGITALYQPVKNGDLYRLKYTATSNRLELSLNGKSLGAIQNAKANQYFLIWFGSKPFSATLKKQLIG